jgi:hypothetical protein
VLLLRQSPRRLCGRSPGGRHAPGPGSCSDQGAPLRGGEGGRAEGRGGGAGGVGGGGGVSERCRETRGLGGAAAAAA